MKAGSPGERVAGSSDAPFDHSGSLRELAAFQLPFSNPWALRCDGMKPKLAGTGKELPLEAMGVIIGVDLIVVMCRTTVNVWGDAVGAKINTQLAPDTEDGDK